MEKETTAGTALAPVNASLVEQVAAQAERLRIMRAQVVGRIAKITKPNDWIMAGENPYLQAKGCERVAESFDICWEYIKDPRTGLPIINETRENKPEVGEVVTYEVWASFWFAAAPDRRVEAFGTKSSDNDFFSKRKEGRLQIGQVNLANIKKSAITNCRHNGICQLLGLNGLSVAELGAAGLAVGSITGVTYNQGANLPAEAKSYEAVTRNKMWNFLLTINAGDVPASKKQLAELSGFEGWVDKNDHKKGKKNVKGKDDPKDLSGKWLHATYGKIEKMAEERKMNMADFESGPKLDGVKVEVDENGQVPDGAGDDDIKY